MRIKRWCIVLLLLSAPEVFADPVASRAVGSNVIYYDSLHEAFVAAGGTFDVPDDITLFADITVYAPLILEDGKHIRLMAGNGNRTIIRGRDFLEFPVIWIRGDNSSLSLGGLEMEHTLTIDGGYLNTPPVLSQSPIVVLNGLDSKLIMYDKVILQNNHNTGAVPGEVSFYRHGGGVFVRTSRDNFNRPVEFIMKGGIIRGNTNKVTHTQSFGGGVIVLSGIFTMEGGSIMNNTAQRTGGGVYISDMATLRKTGGIIYGKNAPAGYRNTGIDYISSGFFAHAISVGERDFSVFRFRDDTVKENEVLTYTALISGKGVFGKGERWQDQYTGLRRNVLICFLAALVFGSFIFFFPRKKAFHKSQPTSKVKSQALIEAEKLLTDREKEILYLFLSGKAAREISQDLDCSVSNVNNYSERIYRKLKVQSRAELLVKLN